jgi:hypothetical protein
MSSKFVRDSILTFLTTELPTETIIDLTAQFDELEDLLTANSITMNDPWIGVQFLGSDEIPISIQSQNQKGCFREIGAIYIHVVDISYMGVHSSILNRSEAIRDLLRGRRINNSVIIEQVGPPNFGEGITLNFEGGFTASAITVYYRRDLDL